MASNYSQYELASKLTELGFEQSPQDPDRIGDDPKLTISDSSADALKGKTVRVRPDLSLDIE